MKKLIVMLLAVFVMLSVVIICPKPNDKSVYALSFSNELSSAIKEELNEYLEVNKVNKTRLDRAAGSEGEKSAAQFILKELILFGLTPKNQNNFNNGVMEFEFVNANGQYDKSYNISATIKSSKENAKTVVILTHYDNIALYSTLADINGNEVTTLVNGETVNADSGTVAALLLIAKILKTEAIDLDFNVEFAFLGAGNSQNAGAVEFLRSLDKENVGLVMLVNNITIGDFNYVYSSDFKTNYGEKIANIVNGQNNFSAYNKLSNIYQTDENVYYHAGKTPESDLFLNSGLKLVSFFSGNYSSILDAGKPESKTQANITGTENDTISGIEKEYDQSVGDNLARISCAIVNLILDEQMPEIVNSNENVAAHINFWSNYKYVILTCGAVVIVLIIACNIIFSVLANKSDKRAEKSDVDQIVMNITSSLNIKDDSLNQKIKDKIEGKGKKKE